MSLTILKNMRTSFALVFLMSVTSFAPLSKEAEVSVFTEDLYPIQYKENGLITGPTTKFVEEVLQTANLSYSIKMQPWARIYNTALHQRNSVIYSMAKTEQRAPLFHWFRLLITLDFSLYKLKSNPIDPTSPEFSLNNYKISTLRHSAVHHHLNTLGIKSLELVSKSEQNIKKLLSGRVDIISGVDNLFYENCHEVKLSCNQIEPFYQLSDLSTELYFALSKLSDPQKVQKIATAYQAVLERKKENDD